nr:hypothetical protein MFMH1_83200 [Myxococcus sp. MH1]
MSENVMVRQELLQRIYSRIFPSPRERTADGKPAGIERRQELCRMLAPTNMGSIPPSVWGDVNSVLSAHAGENLVLDFSAQLVPLRMALVDPAYVALRNTQGDKTNTPRRLGGVLVLDVGPYELQLTYHALLSHTNAQSEAGMLAHELLTRLKRAAIFDEPDKIRAVLQEAYDSDVLLDSQDRLHSGVKLIFGDDFIAQLQRLIAPNQLVKLEPYGDGDLALCVMPLHRHLRRPNCY